MPAKDIFHDAVRSALEKDSWKITHDPLSITVDGMELNFISIWQQKDFWQQKKTDKR